MFISTTDRHILTYLKARFDSQTRAFNNLVGLVTQLDACEYLRQIPDNSVDFIFTDEPYGVSPTKINLKMRKDIVTVLIGTRRKTLMRFTKVFLLGIIN